MEMIDILNKLREFEQPVNEATITTQQIEAFKKWHEKYSKMKTRDVYNYAEGIFKAHMETGNTELDGYSRQDPEGKAYDELNAIFPSMKAEVEEIGNALRAKGIDPFSGEKFSESEQPVAELDDKQRTASSLKYSADPRVAYFDKMMKRYGPKLMELIIDHSHIISNDEKKGEEKLKKYGEEDLSDFLDRFNHLDGVEENFIDMLTTAVEEEEGLIDFFYDRVEQAKKAGNFSKTSRIPDPDEYDEIGVANKHDESVSEDAGKDKKIVDMLRDIQQYLYNHPNMSEHPSLVALDQLADDLESGDKPADYESVEEGGVKNWLMDMEQDATEMSREEFIKKHGQSQVDVYDRIQKEKEEVGESKMKKETVKEAIQMSADTPQEANVLMQILKLAGIEPKAEQEGCGCDDNCSCGGNCGADCDCENCGKQEETYANEPDTKTQSVDDLVNVHSGGLNRQKQQFAKAQDGDNAMAVETLANSLKEQYKAFKEAYQQEASKAKNPYAIGMAQAMKSTGDKPPLEKSTITKAHDIAKSIEKKA